MATTTIFGEEIPDYDADQDTWGTILNAYLNALEAKFGPVLVDNGTISSAQATLDVELPADYRRFVLRVGEMEPVTDGAVLWARASVDGGATYLNSGNYTYAGYAVTSVPTDGAITSGGLTTNQIVLSGAFSNTAGFNAMIDMEIAAASGFNTRVKYGVGHSAQTTGADVNVDGYGRVVSSTLATHVRLMFSTGNIAKCRWALYGLRGL